MYATSSKLSGSSGCLLSTFSSHRSKWAIQHLVIPKQQQQQQQLKSKWLAGTGLPTTKAATHFSAVRRSLRTVVASSTNGSANSDGKTLVGLIHSLNGKLDSILFWGIYNQAMGNSNRVEFLIFRASFWILLHLESCRSVGVSAPAERNQGDSRRGSNSGTIILPEARWDSLLGAALAAASVGIGQARAQAWRIADWPWLQLSKQDVSFSLLSTQNVHSQKCKSSWSRLRTLSVLYGLDFDRARMLSGVW